MRLLPVLTATLVVVALYFLVLERDAVLRFAAGSNAQVVATDEPADSGPAGIPPSGTGETVSVVALRSVAQVVDGAVILRGRTEAARQVDVRAETSGRVISEPARRGATVTEGDLLCVLDPGTRQVALNEAEARLREAELRLPEAEARLVEADISGRAAARLNQGGFASETRVAQTAAAVEAARAGVESAKSGIQAAEAAVAAARNELGKLEIRAPFSGLLESDAAELGSLLQPGSLCATVIQLDTIKLVGFVPEIHLERVSAGATAYARLTSGRTVAGRVTFLSRSADPSTRTFRVEVEVANDDLAIGDGQTAEIAIQSAGRDAHLLPQSSLTLNDDGQLGVRIIRDMKAAFAEVSVVRDSAEGIWVTGLEPEADVIVTGQEYVTDGAPVAARFRERGE
ncbi:MAG: efflux RND transporter periplasmic adaptor subunit [Boseongicola sp. SB0673_bin_14]|nr:efflux RND transporter periplasmic adaptor subunit [Boseongicola sp. SB0667_bin_21]MYI69895.1 efflux RND transporter periplasmic adaptor subunit [Boseongicola sp. SB0673_bin_14]